MGTRATARVICCARLDGAPELQRVLDLCDLEEVLVIGDAQRAHAVLVPPLLRGRRLPTMKRTALTSQPCSHISSLPN